jgi:hypothetical protein
MEQMMQCLEVSIEKMDAKRHHQQETMEAKTYSHLGSRSEGDLSSKDAGWDRDWPGTKGSLK